MANPRPPHPSQLAMANPLPPRSGGPPSGTASAPSPAPAAKDEKVLTAEQLVLDICDPALREDALALLSLVNGPFLLLLLSLSVNRDKFQQDIAPLIWHSFGTMPALLLEILSVYPTLCHATLSQDQSNRVCNALALLQCVASHPDTRMPFINAQIPVYLYPILNNTFKTKPYECLRLTSLGVIGALVKCLPCAKHSPPHRIERRDIQPSPRAQSETQGSGDRDVTARRWLHQLLHNIAMANIGYSGPHVGLNRIMGM
nr:unnamed protein product [Digitaria exilis]